MTIPTWDQLWIYVVGAASSIAWWLERRDKRDHAEDAKKVEELERKIEHLETEVGKVEKAASDAMEAKNAELALMRNERDWWRERCQHLETLIPLYREGRQ